MKTAVAFIIFNRPEVTEEVFRRIQAIKPPRLYVIADGPRGNREKEFELCHKTQSIVKNGVNWDCEVFYNISEANMGCGLRVSTGVDWFFEHEEQGIILEDDCLPDLTFFRFCEDLLERYKNDNRIGQISGFNGFQMDQELGNYSYLFSSYGSIWGWASWRRAWKSYDYNFFEMDLSDDFYESFCRSDKQIRLRKDIYKKVSLKLIDTWDYQWGATKFFNNFLNIIPMNNLIENIGFGEDATHTRSKPRNKEVHTEISSMEYPLIHPSGVFSSSFYDKRFSKIVEGCSRNLIFRILRRLKLIPRGK